MSAPPPQKTAAVVARAADPPAHPRGMDSTAILRSQLLGVNAVDAQALSRGKKKRRAAAAKKGPAAKAKSVGAATSAMRARVEAEAAAAARHAEGARLRMQHRPFAVSEKGCASAQRVAARLAARLKR